VDPRRNYPPDPGTPDPDARWYDERQYSPSYNPEYASPEYTPDYGSGYDPFAKPQSETPGYGDPVPAPLPPPQPIGPPVSGGGGLGGSVNGSAPTGEVPLDDYSRHRAEALDRDELRRTAAQMPTQMTSQVPVSAGGSVYHGKRPGLVVLLAVLTVLFELPVLRIFFSSALTSPVNAPGTISSIFMILGLPMFALGLYGLISGAAAMANGPRAWLRVPLAYLPVGLLLFLAAALA
jgi:hypothetical protein